MKTGSFAVRSVALLQVALQIQVAVHAFTVPSQSRIQLTAAVKNRPSCIANSLSLSAAASTTTNRSDDPYASPQLDTAALLKYAIAGTVELSLFGLAFQTFDSVLSRFHCTASRLPLPLLSFLFYAISLKSRAFNPLNNQRPDRSKALDGRPSNGFRDRTMPPWTPPGVVFPIMWLLIIGPLRAYSSALLVKTTSTFLSVPIMAFVAHLTIGDIWNTINNTEKRYGASVIAVLAVLASAVHAAYRYHEILPLAGKLLGITCLWLVIAAALIADTWRLNPIQSGGVGDYGRVPLYPVRGEAETGFVWFGRGAGSGDDSNQVDSMVPVGPGCIRKVEDEDCVEEKVTYRNQAHLHRVLLSGENWQ